MKRLIINTCIVIIYSYEEHSRLFRQMLLSRTKLLNTTLQNHNFRVVLSYFTLGEVIP